MACLLPRKACPGFQNSSRKLRPEPDAVNKHFLSNSTRGHTVCSGRPEPHRLGPSLGPAGSVPLCNLSEGLALGQQTPRGSGTLPVTADQIQRGVTHPRFSDRKRPCSSDRTWTRRETHLPKQEGVHPQAHSRSGKGPGKGVLSTSCSR